MSRQVFKNALDALPLRHYFIQARYVAVSVRSLKNLHIAVYCVYVVSASGRLREYVLLEAHAKLSFCHPELLYKVDILIFFIQP